MSLELGGEYGNHGIEMAPKAMGLGEMTKRVSVESHEVSLRYTKV